MLPHAPLQPTNMHPTGKLPASIHITADMYHHRLICATYQKQLQSYEKYLTFANFCKIKAKNETKF
jgi:hypothetical protein